MRTRLELLRPVRTVDDYGAESVHYEPTRVAYAEQVRHTARLHNEVG